MDFDDLSKSYGPRKSNLPSNDEMTGAGQNHGMATELFKVLMQNIMVLNFEIFQFF